MTRNALLALTAASTALLAATPALAAIITASGAQTAGVAGRNASLSGQPVTLPAGCTIASASVTFNCP